MRIKFKRIKTKGGYAVPPPAYQTRGAAGFDLAAALDAPVTIGPGGRAVIPAGLALEIPEGYAVFVFARSGLAVKRGLALSNGVGVIDADYRGELKVGLVNLASDAYTVRPGERIAQAVVLEVAAAELIEANELGETERADGGFGSTGK